jgi:hypothetical protein
VQDPFRPSSLDDVFLKAPCADRMQERKGFDQIRLAGPVRP